MPFHKGPRQKIGTAGGFYPDFAHHLANDDLDMLIVDVDALIAVDSLHFLGQIRLNGLGPSYFQKLVGIDGTLGKGVAGLYALIVAHLEASAVGNGVHMGLTIGTFNFYFSLGLLFVNLD